MSPKGIVKGHVILGTCFLCVEAGDHSSYNNGSGHVTVKMTQWSSPVNSYNLFMCCEHGREAAIALVAMETALVLLGI